MTVQVGAHGLEIFGDARPELLFNVTRIKPKMECKWVDLKSFGVRSTQRLWVSDFAGGVAMATWPAELAPQAKYLYGRRRGSTLVTAARERGWTVEASPHLAYWRSPPGRRLYMSLSITPLDYVERWEDEDGLGRPGRYARENVKPDLWRWLKQEEFASDGDDAELERFLDLLPRQRGVDMRPGLRFRRVWTAAKVAELGSTLAATMRSEFDAVFAAADEPPLSSAQT